MKKIKYILWVFVLATITLSCTDNDLADIQEDKQVTENSIKLNYNIFSATDVSISRAIEMVPIEDLQVFIFDENGRLMTDEVPFFNSTTLNDQTNGSLGEVHYPAINETAYSGWVRLSLKNEYTKESKARILMVANTLNMQSVYTQKTLTQISEITTINELLSFICEYQEKVVRPNNDRLMITGTYNINEGAINDQTNLISFTIGEWNNRFINMYRMDAKINFNVTAGEGCKFTLNSYQVYNVPKKAYLFWKYDLTRGGSVGEAYPLFNKDAATKKDDFFSTKEIKVNAVAGQSSPASFNFYMPENLKKPKNFSKWNDHNKSEKDKLVFRETHTTGSERKFTNAPDNATYVILRGTYEGKTTVDGQSKDVTAEVSYIIHLGFRDVANNSTPSWNNFKGGTNDYLTRRNFLYTYNVRVNGINSIVTEVIQGGGKMPAAEGEITIEEEAITLPSSSASTITVYKDETLNTKSAESWLKVGDQTITTGKSIKFSKKKECALIADPLPEGTAPREITILGTRTSTNGQSKIIRKITVTQNP